MAEKNNNYEVRYNKKNFIEITKYVNQVSFFLFFSINLTSYNIYIKEELLNVLISIKSFANTSRILFLIRLASPCVSIYRICVFLVHIPLRNLPLSVGPIAYKKAVCLGPNKPHIKSSEQRRRFQQKRSRRQRRCASSLRTFIQQHPGYNKKWEPIPKCYGFFKGSRERRTIAIIIKYVQSGEETKKERICFMFR